MTGPQIAIFTHTQHRNHKTVHGPADTLLDYLNEDLPESVIFFIQHPLQMGDSSHLRVFQNGKPLASKDAGLFKGLPGPLRYCADLFTTLRWLIPKKHLKLIIAVDPLNFFYAYCLKKIGKADKLVYYTVDYAFQRFSNPLLNKIYHFMDMFAVRQADALWSACTRIQDVRRQQGVHDDKNLYISNTPFLKEKDIIDTKEKDRFSLVNIFSNHAQVDFDIMFDALSLLIGYFPKVSLKLIGKGDFAGEIIPKIKDRRLLERIKFMDISTHDEALREVSSSSIGLECNTQTLAWNAFREPIKVMEYIALGLPIISKPGHGMVDEIAREGLGFVVNDAKGLFEAARSLFSEPSLYSEIRGNLASFAKKNDKKNAINRSIDGLIN